MPCGGSAELDQYGTDGVGAFVGPESLLWLFSAYRRSDTLGFDY